MNYTKNDIVKIIEESSAFEQNKKDYEIFCKKYPNFLSSYTEYKYFLLNRYKNDYIDKLFCSACGINRVKFISMKKGYRRFCSYKCSNSSEDMKQKRQELKTQSIQKKYGVSNIFQVQSIKDDIKQTLLIKYGCENISQNADIKNKKKETLMKNYNVEVPYKSAEIRERGIKTSLERYGTTHPMKNIDVQEKLKIVFLEKYGVDNPMKNQEIQSKLSKIISSNDVRQKVYDTHIKNNSFNKSSTEDEIYEILTEIFGNENVYRQYMDERYPFSCDFYIKSIDLFIEFNGTWTHGGEPFDTENSDHLSKLQFWKNKNTRYYKNAIYTWTDLDVRKRKIAYENNLNYLEFFEKTQLEDWIKNSLLNNDYKNDIV